MKCEKCHERKLCRTIDFGGLNDDIKIYLCFDCSHWMYSYIINNVFDDEDSSDEDSSDEDSTHVDPSLCLSCKKIYTDVDDITDNKCRHCEYHDWYGKHCR